MKHHLLALFIVVAALGAHAKLPPPDDAAKAKAEETAQRAAWTNAVGNFQLCKAQDKVAAKYRTSAAGAASAPGPVVATPSCQDPGPFALKKDATLPLEASGAHSPARDAVAPPSSNATDAQLRGQTKKP